jgi:hypothetical protein
MSNMDPWLARLQHDLVKRLLWPARDRRDMGGTPASGELIVRLSDDEGRPVGALACWQGLRGEAPGSLPAAALNHFDRAIERAVSAAEAGDLEGVLALDAAFAALGAALARKG